LTATQANLKMQAKFSKNETDAYYTFKKSHSNLFMNVNASSENLVEIGECIDKAVANWGLLYNVINKGYYLFSKKFFLYLQFNE